MSALKEAKMKGNTNIKSVQLRSDSKGVEKIPAGAEIVKNDVRVDIEEIENGFLIVKNFDVEYILKGKDGGGNKQYAYYSKKWFSETNPLSINTEDKSLADLFD